MASFAPRVTLPGSVTDRAQPDGPDTVLKGRIPKGEQGPKGGA